MDDRLQRRVQRYGWDRAAPAYDRSWGRQLAPAHDLLVAMAGVKRGERVFEAACGSGLVTRRLAEAVGSGGRVVATDLSGEMVALAAAAVPGDHVEVRRMDAEDLDLPPRAFDLAVCALGLMYAPRPDRALQEMYRVLRPGGRAAAAVWGRRTACGWAEIFPIVDARVETDVCPLFFQLGGPKALHEAFTSAGFGAVRVERIATVLEYASETEALEAAFDGGAVAMAYRRFDPAVREAVHREYLASIEPFRVGDGYRVPGEFVVGVGVAGEGAGGGRGAGP